MKKDCEYMTLADIVRYIKQVCCNDLGGEL